MPKFDASTWDEQTYKARHAMQERPPRKYLIETLLVLPSLNIFYGLPGSHKTNAVIDLAVCVALGKSWLANGKDFAGFESHKSSVLWMDSDSGVDALHERFGAALRAHADNTAQAMRAPISYMSFPNPPFSARNDAAVHEIVARALKLKVRLIVFDNLGTASGGADENSYEMILVMNNLRFIAEKTGACVIVIHHDTKNAGSRKSPRGHSSIEASINLALWIERDDDAIVFTPTKQRDAPFDSFSALFEYSHKVNTETLLESRFLGVESIADPTSARAQSAIVNYLRSNGHIANQAKLVEICKSAKIGRPRAVSELHRLVRKNILVIKAGQAHNAMLFMLKEKT